jgi:hypothetical protein
MIRKDIYKNKLIGDYIVEVKSDGSLLPYNEKGTKNNGRKKNKSKTPC